MGTGQGGQVGITKSSSKAKMEKYNSKKGWIVVSSFIPKFNFSLWTKVDAISSNS